jgi:hypothetical protein
VEATYTATATFEECPQRHLTEYLRLPAAQFALLNAAQVQVSFLGDAKSSLGDGKSSLGDAKSSLGDAKSSLGDAKSSLGDATSSLGDAKRLAG